MTSLGRDVTQRPTHNGQLPTTNRQLPTANCQLPTATPQFFLKFFSKFEFYKILVPLGDVTGRDVTQRPTPNGQLPTANRQLPTANHQLPTANCHTPPGLLHAHSPVTSPGITGGPDRQTHTRTDTGLYRGGGALSRNFPGTFLKFSFLLIAYGSPVPPPAGGKGAGFFP